ncbi:MAG: hypothetical protein M9921_06395 [Fimbriimonadaceae bacterium]|nr:hypothetical protein [Chthonomonadaceae bacterium]MCO5296471.1 hypothetical protein [Fimbriimonadaceae bacterium]
MKLNLLPSSVSKGKQTQTAIVLSALIAVIGIVGAVGMISASRNERANAINEAENARPRAELAASTSKYADEVISQARVILININLAEAMKNHNTVYPDLYDEVRRYIPAFYRVTSMQATPGGADTTVVTMNGVLASYQQYADLMLALYRIPGAQTVSRTGYQYTSPFVPGLTPVDQTGRPVAPGQGPIPDDPLARLDYFIAQGTVTGFTGTGGFGTGPGVRGAMPGESAVTVSVVLQRNSQTPNPRATLAGIGSVAPPAPGGFPGAPPAGGGVSPAGAPAVPAGRGGPPRDRFDEE